MKVKLIAKTQNLLDVIYTSARTCYNPGSPIDMWNDACCIPTDKKKNLVNKVFQSGHLSTAEHSQFTFAIEGISRACSHQLVRHRLCSFSQQSQRYVEIKENYLEICDLYHKFYNDIYTENKVKEIVEKYFVIQTKEENKHLQYLNCLDSLAQYLELIEKGEKPEIARDILPNCTKTNIVVTCNLRELMHFSNERLCSRAQKEIRMMAQQMVKEVVRDEEWLKPYLVPKCEVDGFCKEHQSCGRKKTLPVLLGEEYNKGLEDGWRSC